MSVPGRRHWVDVDEVAGALEELLQLGVPNPSGLESVDPARKVVNPPVRQCVGQMLVTAGLEVDDPVSYFGVQGDGMSASHDELQPAHKRN